ncbi:MAG: Fe-S cluster assembly protein SufD [Actinomycetes bacterium]
MTALDTTRAEQSLDALTEDALVARSEAAGEPAWLTDLRTASLKRYADQAWPDSRVDEFWRSTPFAKRFDTTLPLVTGDAGDVEVPTSLTASVEAATALARIVDGVVVEIDVPTHLAEQGVVVTTLAEAATSHEALVRAHLGSLTTVAEDGTGTDEDRTVTVNDAAFTAGVFVHVPADVEVDAPIGVHLHVATPGAHLPRVLVHLGHHAKATVYLEHTSADLDGRALVSQVVESVLGDGAMLDLVSLQEWTDDVDHLALQKAAVHRDATYRPLAIVVGGRTVRLRPEVDLVGAGGSTFPLGVYYADDGQWFDLQPYIRHIAPRATSDVLYKGALQGESRTVFRGNVFVAEEAVGTNTDENNKSLILSHGARADATPFLEILCADIQAGHGSATGQIDANALYYLESRGIRREQAIRLIVSGFFREVLDRIDAPGVEERTMEHIEREIARADIASIGISDAVLPTEEA